MRVKIKEYKISNMSIEKWFQAARDGNLNLIKEYLENGFDVNIENNFSNNVLIIASIYDNINIVREIITNPFIDINHKNNNGDTALIRALTVKVINELLKHPNINVNIQNNKGKSALMEYSYHNDVYSVKELLTHPNVNVNLKDINGKTALHLTYNRDIIKELLKHPDIDINIKDYNGKTALDCAIEDELFFKTQLIKDYKTNSIDNIFY